MKYKTQATFIALDERAARTGRILGALAASVLRARCRAYLRQVKARRIPAHLLRARVTDFKRLLKDVAPHWLNEAQAMARAAGLHVDDILLLNCQLPDMPEPSPLHCTTWLAVGKDTNRLLKIRDERNHVQTFYIALLPDGKTPLHLAKDIGNLGVAHFFSGRPLAGANNTGGHVRLPDAARLNDCHVLRFIAEHAENVREIPKLFEQLMAKKAVGGASRERGAVYTFIDAKQGLLVETGADDYACKFFSRGSVVVANHFLLPASQKWLLQPPNENTLIRKARMEELLAQLRRVPTPQELFAITRDRKNAPHALCNDDQAHFWMTISAQLHVINRRRPEQSVNYVCCGNTRHSFYVPVPLAFRKNFVPLLTGDYYRRSDILYRKHHCRAHLMAWQRRFEASSLPPEQAWPEAYRLLCSVG